MSQLQEYSQFYVRLMDGSQGYADQYRCLINRLESFAGRELAPSDLDATLINDYLASARDLADRTRKWRRNALVRIWRHAASNPALEKRPAPPQEESIARVKTRGRVVRAWSSDDLRTMLAAVDELTGYYALFSPSSKVLFSKRRYWRSYILAAWSLGWRPCDLLQLEYDWIPAHGRLSIVQKKTGKVTVGVLSSEALCAINDWWTAGTVDRDTGKTVTPDRRVIWPVWCQRACWFRIAKRLITNSGLHGSIGKIRHAAGTNVELRHPGSGPHFLGNTADVFYSTYFDRSQFADVPSPELLTSK